MNKGRALEGEESWRDDKCALASYLTGVSERLADRHLQDSLRQNLADVG